MGIFSKKWDGEIKSPVSGKTYSIEKVKDEMFSKKMMGDGIAIKPTSSKIYAPITGKITTAFFTKHAVGITNKEGLNILIHIGIDTVKLDGEGFKTFIEQNQKIKKGDLLVEIDIPYINKNAISSDIIMVITPESKIKASKIINNQSVTINDTIIFT